jgi:isocitrate dehydrogenase kinase/phosphatase
MSTKRLQMSNLEQATDLILTGFGRYFQCFQLMTQAARGLFEKACWSETQDISKQRIDLYKEIVMEIAAELQDQAGTDCALPAFWESLKPVYRQRINALDNRELLETFYNSICCYLFRHERIDDRFMFVADDTSSMPDHIDDSLINRYTIGSSIRALIYKILSDYSKNIHMENIERDVRHIVYAIKEKVLPHMPEERENIVVDVLKSLFFRNKGAYLVGQITDGSHHIPFIIPLIYNERGRVYVDTAIFDTDDVSIIFSFTRSYFMVDTPIPGQIVYFLKLLMPNKEIAELYNAIGQNKHGKTEFYRSFLHHLQHSSDQFIIAPGIKGMVMCVFTLPSYDVVFKIIKDKFDPPKEMSHETVREKYRLVSRHDRVGRMADTQEYSHFRFPVSRFSPELLAELQKVVPSQIRFEGDELVVLHLYTERKMIPLNLYLQTASDEQIEEAMDEYGNAIKQIAAANIFPGDMLLKNFGVTRHGRVVFYDYDEICFLTECLFRVLPEPQNDEQAMSSTPWYNVDPFDVFPEEFRLFFTGNPKAKRAFEKFHSDLYHVDFWRNMQDRIRNGNMEDIFPYRRKKRFTRELPAHKA